MSGHSDPVGSADVIIVGAGPTGSSAAVHLARAGTDVLLLEKSTFPRDKVCGDGLTPRGAQLRLAGGDWADKVIRTSNRAAPRV
ncbi:MAG: FAD-dependent oxidoreductase [Nakamurella sp.]